jgi:hypothetical protein
MSFMPVYPYLYVVIFTAASSYFFTAILKKKLSRVVCKCNFGLVESEVQFTTVLKNLRLRISGIVHSKDEAVLDKYP